MDTILSGRNNGALEAILGAIPPEVKTNSSRGTETIEAMLNSLLAVLRRDMLCVPDLQSGVIDAVRWCRDYLGVVKDGRSLLLAVEAGLTRLEALESQFLYWTQGQFAGGELVNQSGRAVTEGEQFALGVKWGLRYVKQQCERFDGAQVGTERSHYPINSKLQSYGFFYQEQRDFVNNVLPKLEEWFEDRPTGHSSWVPTKQDFPYTFKKGVAELLEVKPWNLTEAQCLRLLEQVGEKIFLSSLSERLRWIASLGFGYDDLKDPKDARSVIAACFEADRRRKEE